jgi:lipopolysaccharide transport system permease protein
MLKSLWVHRGLVYTMTRRQYDLRYRQSFVGVSWALLPPLASLAAATLVFHGVVSVDTGGVSYPLFAMAALAPWTFFANSLTVGVPIVQQAQHMVTRLAFPRAALPLSMIGISVIDLGIACAMFLAVALLVEGGLPVTALWFPVILIIELLLVTGLVLVGSALNVFARDVRLAVPVLVQLWLFITPVMYPLSETPLGLRAFFLANPMTGVVETSRRVLVYGKPPEAEMLLIAATGACLFFLIGAWYFSVTERRFADVL